MAPDDVRRKAIQMYRTTDLTTTEIAEQLGVSRSSLYNWLNAAGVVGERRRPHAHAATPPITDVARLLEEVAELRELVHSRAVVGDVVSAIKEELEEWHEWHMENRRDMATFHSAIEGFQLVNAEIRAGVAQLLTATQNNTAAVGRLSGLVEALLQSEKSRRSS